MHLITQIIVLFAILIGNSIQNELMESKITNDGYKTEFHTVKTSDGYFLQLVRIQNDEKLPENAPVMLLMHGLFQSSGVWICQNDTKNSLAYQLRDAGNDVWLGNVRGTTLSQKHDKWDKDQNAHEFWDYTMHEIGTIDLPDMIDYILKVTKQGKLNYVGYSMGGTNFFILTSMIPEYNEKISNAYLIAPAVFLGNAQSELMHQIANNAELIQADWELWGVHRLGFTPDLFTLTMNAICGQSRFMQEICKSTVLRVIGQENDETDMNNLAETRKYYTDMASTQQILQYFQMINSGKFWPLDFKNEKKNIYKYGVPTPTDYDLSQVKVPITVFYGTADGLVSPKDAEILKEKVSTIKNEFMLEKWNHLDMVLGKNVRTAIHDRIIEDLNSK
uniref:Lipase n=1 Tax=Culicoides sonorensis TaxID=179676 RepID=A0A336MM78_CULSO